jgi:microcin C transport system substrate-binding protein
MDITRRGALGLLGATTGWVFLLPSVSRKTALAQDADGWRHGTSLFGDLKYAPGFKHFDYVNPDAPKGGRVRLGAIGGFDSLNPYTYKGRPAGLMGLTIDTLTTPSYDEPSAAYGLIAEAVKFPDDYSQVTYRLRPEARFHDGTPITPEDVIFSMEMLKKVDPAYAGYYRNVVRGEKTGDHEVTFHFDEKGNRELPNITGQLPVLPKHWWEGKDASGKPRDLGATTLEAPLGSGPYRVDKVNPGRSITFKRVEDYWAKDLPVNIGKHNFDEVVLEYFLDPTVALEAFKGDQFDWRVENSARAWATAYDTPAVKRGDIVREEFTFDEPAGMQAFAFNLRRDKFSDPRVRRAFNLAFDFEWANKTLFYGLYKRLDSYFANSELAATGLPEGRELELLEGLRDQIPPEVFTTPYTNPVNDKPGAQREHLRQAMELLREAGWEIDKGVLRNKAGEAMTVEFLIADPNFERVVLPYVQALKRLGIQASVRTVDTSQYKSRVDNFDFDIITHRWGQSLSPGNEQRDFWGSEAADQSGSQNVVGIKNPAIDALINKVIYAESREDLVAATRALDRVLLWNHYVVPQWYSPSDRTARWNRFGHPEKMPKYQVGFPTIWWYDPEKAATIKKQG